MSKIRISAGDIEVVAELNDSATAKKIIATLPIEGSCNTWGEEIYFSIPVEADLESDYQSEVVELGAVGYWPPGSAFCLFFGQTPASTATEIRPASAVNVIGKIEGDCTVLKKVATGTAVSISSAD